MAIQPKTPLPPGDTVAEISQFLKPEINQVTAILTGILESDSGLIHEVGHYISLAGGKKLRPMVALLCARAFGPAGLRAPVEIAAAVETVHVATLLHDDVIDKAPMRRGQPSVNARWGDDVAILMADFLYAAAFDLALRYLSADGLLVLTQVTRRMCEGEMFQIERRGAWLNREDYMRIITAKTAVLFGGCAALGCMAAGMKDGVMDHASDFGMKFGMAFQITDDALDYTGDDEVLGKRAGADLDGGKQTLPLILALEKALPADAEQLKTAFSVTRDHAAVRRLIGQYGAVPQALEMARDFAGQARHALAALPVTDEAAFDLLNALPEYVLARRS